MEDSLKSLVQLWQWVAEESATWCRTSTSLDCKTVKARSHAEGLSFLTITLPRFGKDFEQALDQSCIGSSSFPSYKKVKDGRIPAFLQGIVGQVFDRQTGRLVAEPSIDAIRAVRQLTLMFAKIEVDCTPERKAQAVQGFIDCEREVREKNEELSSKALNELSAMSFLLYGNLINSVERKFLSEELVPKHGPGATADKLTGNRKFDLQEWPQRLNHSFPWEAYALPSEREEFLSEEISSLRVSSLYPEQERPVKVTLVPKTLEKPRIIAIEPTAMQYAQQSLLEAFVEILEAPFADNDYFSSRANRVYGMIGFTDQEPNQLLAKTGSLPHGGLATLDLSEASDRVSNLHVMALFSRFPQLLVAIQDCRSTKAVIPDGRVIPLAKFASMGSALCFPMEAMVFLAVVFLGISDALNRPLTAKDILSFADRVRVYGDDIVVPVEYVQSVMNRLCLYGFKTNTNKSFWTGMFRESCGKEFYAGADVSIQRVRKEFPSSRLDAEETISLVSLRNRLFTAGFRTTVQKLDERVGKILPLYPLVRPTSPLLGRWSDHPSLYDVDRINQHTQSPQVRGYRVASRPPISPISGRGALLKFFLKRGQKPLDEKHLERQGRPKCVDINTGWASPY